jgi:general stress protein YciG
MNREQQQGSQQRNQEFPEAKGHQGFENMPKDTVAAIGAKGGQMGGKIGGLVSGGGLSYEEAKERVEKEEGSSDRR